MTEVKITESEIREKIDQGWFRLKIILEILGFPKEHIEKTTGLVAKRFGELKYINVITSEISVPKSVSEKSWSSFIELEIVVASFSDMIGLIMDYLPSSVEILEPRTFTEDIANLTDILNDFATRLHQHDMEIKKLRAVNNILASRLPPEQRKIAFDEKPKEEEKEGAKPEEKPEGKARETEEKSEKETFKN